MDEKQGGSVEATEPKLKRISGKEFDVSTPIGEAQYDAWVEALSTLVGHQGNEVGELRKFKSEHAATDDEAKLLTQVSELRDQGENAKADQLLFNFTKEAVAKSKRQLEVERTNEKTWRAYFKDRPELLSQFDEDVIRSVSETKLDLSKEENPFGALAAFWKVSPKGGKKTADDEKPPVVPHGGALGAAPKMKSASEAEVPMDDINSFLDNLGKSK